MTKLEKIVLFMLVGFWTTLAVMNLLSISPMENKIKSLEAEIKKNNNDVITFVDNASIDEEEVKKIVDNSLQENFKAQKIIELGGKENYDAWTKTYESSLYKDFMTKKTKADFEFMKQYVLWSMPTNEIQQSMNVPLTNIDSINSLSTWSGSVNISKFLSWSLSLTWQWALNWMLKQDRKQISFITFLNPSSPEAKTFAQKNVISNLRTLPNYSDIIWAWIWYFSSDEKWTKFSQALECVYNISKDRYWVVLNSLLNSQDLDTSLAGVDTTKIKSCIEDWQFAWLVQSQTTYATKNYNFDWTVMSILFNNETKKYYLIRWVQEVETYKALIDELLRK